MTRSSLWIATAVSLFDGSLTYSSIIVSFFPIFASCFGGTAKIESILQPWEEGHSLPCSLAFNIDGVPIICFNDRYY